MSKEILEKDLKDKEEVLERVRMTYFQVLGQIEYIKTKLKELEIADQKNG